MSNGHGLREAPNRILAHLSQADFDLLATELETVDLPLRTKLESRGRPNDDVYFIESGFASVVAGGTGDRDIEVGLIGREGMTGLAVIMGTDRSPNETYMQLDGSGSRIAADALRARMETSATLRHSVLHYGHALFVQTVHTALANGRSKLEERLARWLLMAHDRVDGDQLALTHEFLALMLGVRRPGVTFALSLLERQGLIQVGRGVITIVDRQGLEANANGAYGTAEADHILFEYGQSRLLTRAKR